MGEMSEESQLKWFEEEVLPVLVENGCFSENGEKQTLECCEFESTEKYVSSFSSDPCFAKITLSSPSGTTSRDVLIKFQHLNPVFRQKMRTEPQYANEVNLYNRVMPNFAEFLKSNNQSAEFLEKVAPKCYHASDGGGAPEKAVLVLEDLRKEGFRLSEEATDLDLQHCSISVERLSRFHALSFAMKFKGWEPFENLKTLFQEVLLLDDPESRQQCEDFQGYVCHRGIDYLLSQKNSDVLKDYLENLRRTLQPFFEFLKSVHTPTEPLSVICHGDFNRNNLLYRYSNGQVVDAKLIDFQRVLYGPPSLDLGFFIYMNTTFRFRQDHFDEIFQYYYSSLVKNVSMITAESETAIADWIPVQAFRKDFERTALFHYTTVAFFLPLMMTPPDDEFEDDIQNKTFRQMAEKNYKQGGEEVSKRISEVLLDFYERKFYMQGAQKPDESHREP